jgi:ABC-2 type transport system ATP-binding protein
MMLEVQGLYKSFKTVQAVKDFSFKVKKGEVLGLIGPNGCGKTTTLRCICTIIRPDAGTIRINGRDIATDPIEAKRGLAYVPEIPYPYDFLTVDEHIEFAARVFKLKGWESKAAEMIEQFDLNEKRRELIKHLSKGQKQKVNIICAFIHDPTIILLDEPLYGIDPKGGRYLKRLVKSARVRGASIIISSHMLGLVEELATNILIMDKGKKIAEGTVDEVTRLAHLKKGSTLEDVYIQITEERQQRTG